MHPCDLVGLVNIAGVLITCVHISISAEFEQWSPRNSHRTDLFCSKSCEKSRYDSYEQCCCCESKTCSELIPPSCQVTDTVLHIEYVEAVGESILLQKPRETYTTNFVVQHVDGYMRKFPQNLIQFRNITRIDFSRNRITEIGNITFLSDLSELILEGNKIRQISNRTFHGLVKLRTINLSRNFIKDIDPNTISSGLNIFSLDISYNSLTELDITNLIPEGPTCELVYNYNPIQSIVNRLGFEFNVSKQYGDGWIKMNNSSLQSLMNWTSFGLNDYADLGKTVTYGIYYFGSKSLNCDCSLIPYFVNIPAPALKQQLADMDKVMCTSPQRQQGKTLYDVYNAKDKWDELVCNIIDGCPSKCHCYDIQIRKRLVVDCSNLSLSEMPESLPIGNWGSKEIDLLLANNRITRLDNKDYINRLSLLDMTGNIITFVDNKAVSHMTPSIELYIPNNTLQILPKEFRYLDPDNLCIGDEYLQCSCEFLWAENWQRYKLHDINKSLHCNYQSSIFHIDGMSNIVTDCTNQSLEFPNLAWIIIGLLLGLLASGISLYIYRYEIFILYRRCRLHILERKFVLSPDDMDSIFICCDGVNLDTLQWAARELVPYLKSEGFKTTLPYLDILPGSLIETETTAAVKCSRVYIIVLSLSQGNKSEEDNNFKSSLKFEFSIIWREFASQSMKKIIVVNFDQLESESVEDRRLKALVRVGVVADFYDREELLLIKIRKHLSKLLSSSSSRLADNEQIHVEGTEIMHLSNVNYLDTEQGTRTMDNMDDHSLCQHYYNDASPNYHDSVNEGNVFKRLNAPKATTCNCKYRKCYLKGTIMHGEQ
ncbi:hypothetical protein ACJMK2_039143 [Sinanodonta woodiana]|uniref:TIR domain-containing protein n=1 Tax=Sinanodonta woodiana TaxID=1069815 RepID=A0ABD3WB40_SINWO